MRTPNMRYMVVTLEVSQLDMSALDNDQKRLLMSVMADTSQSAMGPYVATAEATSMLYAWTAVFRAVLVVKM